MGCDHPGFLDTNLDWSKAMPDSKYPSIDFLRQCLREEDGRVFWLQRPREHFATDRAYSTWNTRFSGKEAGMPHGDDSHPRWLVRINGVHFLRHILVWAIRNGEWQIGLDHQNRNPLDDRVENLRIASQSQNNANTNLRKNSTSGYKGVTWDKINHKWIAQISVNGRHIKLGRFDDPEEAHAAYVDAANKYFGDFSCPE